MGSSKQKKKRRGPMGGRIGSCSPWQNLRRISKVCSGGLYCFFSPQKFFIGCKHATTGMYAMPAKAEMEWAVCSVCGRSSGAFRAPGSIFFTNLACNACSIAIMKSCVIFLLMQGKARQASLAAHEERKLVRERPEHAATARTHARTHILGTVFTRNIARTCELVVNFPSPSLTAAA